jgi:proline iminopeptidase
VAAILLSSVMGACASARGEDVAPRSITRSERVAVNGAKLFLQVRGADRSAPVLVWLHGGPGGAERPLFRYFNGQLEEDFVVAYWDQRGAGRSFDARADPRQLTVARHLADLDAVVDHLTRALDQDCVVLIGHSWGSALGLLYASGHPEKVCGFIGVNQVVSTLEAQRAQYDFVLQGASSRHDRDALGQLREIGEPPFETVDQVLSIERLVARYGGVFHRPPARVWVAIKLIFRRLVTPWEIPRLIRANLVSLEAMHEELLALDLERRVPHVDVPVFFFLGRHDRQTEALLAARYIAELEAPVKRLIWFENSAHNIPFEEPARFNAAVVQELRSTALRCPGTTARMASSTCPADRPALAPDPPDPRAGGRLAPLLEARARCTW